MPTASGQKKSQQQEFTELRTVGVSMCTPVVRMLVIEVGVNEGEPCDLWWNIYPVIALRTRIVNVLSMRSDTRPSSAGTLRDLLRRGWRLARQESDTEALIVDQDYGLIHYADPLLHSCNVFQELVCAPWPAADDEVQLAEVKGRLNERAMLYFKHQVLRTPVSRQE
jgi:hypothetical protein